VDSIHEFRELPLDESLPAIMNQVRDWTGEESIHDDATMLAIEYLES
jgi:serine phosphatase RsbU (regulator of sigma subunit)